MYSVFNVTEKLKFKNRKLYASYCGSIPHTSVCFLAFSFDLQPSWSREGCMWKLQERTRQPPAQCNNSSQRPPAYYSGYRCGGWGCLEAVSLPLPATGRSRELYTTLKQERENTLSLCRRNSNVVDTFGKGRFKIIFLPLKGEVDFIE